MAPSTTAADAAPFVAALTAANLPDWLRWTVKMRPRRRSLGLTVEPGGAVTVAVPPGATPARVVSFIQSSLGRLRPMVRKSEEVAVTNPVKDLINGEGFNLIGTPYRLHLVDDSDTGRRCGCQCGRLITAHPGVPIIGEPGHSGWSSGRRYQLTMRRDARSALTVVDWYRREGQAWIDKHAPALVSRLGVTPAPTFRVRGLDLRAPRTWATYLPRTHTISVHWALFQAPRELVEYVIAHEIAHAARPKGKPHGPQWQNLVARLVFDWKDKQARLGEAARDFWWGHIDETASPVPQPCTTTRQEHLPMPAEGKNNAAGIAADVAAGKTVRIRITDDPHGKHASPAVLAGEATPSMWYPANVKTKVVTATVTGHDAEMVGGRRRASRRYTLHTDKGDVPGLAPIETLWLAPEPKNEPAPAADATPDIIGKWLTRSDGTVGQVATVEQFQGALGNDECTGVTYTDGVSETYQTIYLPEPVPAPETTAEPTASGETRTDPAAALRAAAELDWPDTDSTIYRGSVGRYLCEQAERHAGTPAAGEFHTLADEWPDEGVTEWRCVRRMLLDRADQIDAQTAGSPAEPPRYAVGDRVLVRRRDEMTLGVVMGVVNYPDEENIPTHYDVHVIPAGSIPVFGEDLSPAPVPQPGQRWVSTSPDRASVLTVIGPSPDKNYPAGLVTDCEEVRGILLSLPHWRPLDESDPADLERLRVAALVRLPNVAAILKRAAKLTGDERAALTNTGMSHHRVFRDAQTDLSSRVARAYGEHWRDLFAVKRHALDVAGASEEKRVAAALDGAYLFAPHAVAYAVFAEVAREFLDDNEYRIFAGPWLDVIGVRA